MREDFLILDIEKENIEILTYKLNEEESLLKIEIEENEKEVELSEYKAKVYFKLPNNELLSYSCKIINNKINIILEEKIFLKIGRVYFEIKLENKTQRVTTFLTYFKVI
jgi:hypothetical protein